jgi:hypothetical protein
MFHSFPESGIIDLGIEKDLINMKIFTELLIKMHFRTLLFVVVREKEGSNLFAIKANAYF